MNKLKQITAVIVDGLEEIHTALEKMLRSRHPEIKLIGHAYSMESGLNLIRSARPKLVFLDIYLQDGSAFDLLQHLGNHELRIIFLSGLTNNTDILKALQFGGLDFLLKPISNQDLTLAIEKAKRDIRPASLRKQLQIAIDSKQTLSLNRLPNMIAINTVEEIFFRRVAEIIRLEASSNYTTFFFANGQPKLMASRPLKDYDNQLSTGKNYMRIHKSHLVNLHFADRYRRKDAVLIMKDGQQLPVSRKKREELIKRLQSL